MVLIGEISGLKTSFINAITSPLRGSNKQKTQGQVLGRECSGSAGLGGIIAVIELLVDGSSQRLQLKHACFGEEAETFLGGKDLFRISQ